MKYFLVLSLMTFMSSTVFAKKVQYRKTQEVQFEASDVDGVARSPDGAYLVQKRGVEFIPLYKLRQNFDEKVKDTVEYVR